MILSTLTSVMINVRDVIAGITQYILKRSNLHLELFSANAKWDKGNVCFNCQLTKSVTWFSEIKIARLVLVLSFENFALKYSIT